MRQSAEVHKKIRLGLDYKNSERIRETNVFKLLILLKTCFTLSTRIGRQGLAITQPIKLCGPPGNFISLLKHLVLVIFMYIKYIK